MTKYGDTAAKADEVLEETRELLRDAQRALREGDTHLAADVLASAHARSEAAERLLVACMRLTGYSWTVVGDALGMTRQAAQQRFGSTE